MSQETEEKNSCRLPEIYHRGERGRAILLLHGFNTEVSRTDIIFKYFAGKGFTVARPILPGHSGSEHDREILRGAGPDQWLGAAQSWLEHLEKETDRIFVIGISFGGNLAAALAPKSRKIAGLVFWEMPIFFTPRMWFVINILQPTLGPLLGLAGIDFIRKNPLIYRRRYGRERRSQSTFNFIPIRAVGKIRKFIRERTMPGLKDITAPVYILHAAKSDLLDNRRTARYIYEHIGSSEKKIYQVPIENHDLNILDDEGKTITLEKVFHFIEGIG